MTFTSHLSVFSVTDGCLAIVAERLPNLCSLELENCYEITDQGE
jgi:hypothetical protein